MLNQWAASKQSGYLTFAWKWAGKTLSSRPGLLASVQEVQRAGSRARASKLVAKAATARSEIHYTSLAGRPLPLTGRGLPGTIRYGRTSHYGRKVNARRPSPLRPFPREVPSGKRNLRP